MLVLTIVLYIEIPKGFFPTQDTGHHSGHFPGSRIHLLHRHVAEAAATGSRNPEGPGRRKASPPSSEPTASTPRSIAAASRSTSKTPPSAASPQAKSSAVSNASLTSVPGIQLYHAAGAGPYRRRPRQPHRIPVHPGRSRPSRTWHLDWQSWSTPCASFRSCATWPRMISPMASPRSWPSIAPPPRA